MSEDVVWRGRASQVKNFGVFVGCGLLCFLVVPIFYALWKWLEVRNREFKITTERLVVVEGVFSRRTNTLELYRVRDLQVTQPFWLRLWGLENIELISTDPTSPAFVLDHLRSELGLGDRLRECVEACRAAKRVRALEGDIDLG